MLITANDKIEYFDALIKRDPTYEGIFFYAVETTGTYCRPTCPSRKPKYEHCHFFRTIKDATEAKFRPCLRCKPTLYPNCNSSQLEKILKDIAARKVWDIDSDGLDNHGINSITIRRQFKKRFGMTYIHYLKLSRFYTAIRLIKKGHSIIEAQQSSNFNSSSGFRDACHRYLGMAPSKLKDAKILYFSMIDTPFGALTTIADEKSLFFLDYVEGKQIVSTFEKIKARTSSIILPGKSEAILKIEKELNQYFNGEIQNFTVPIFFQGTNVQQELMIKALNVPFGEILQINELKSPYSSAQEIDFIIVVPFHRLLNNKKRPFKGNIQMSQWLINHEKSLCAPTIKQIRKIG